ncbi:MAG: PAS domain S-box protein, partial [Thermovirgaceae bacterium]|nr:PAS domain S-box protein [Thermovirgaceae bacterium]
IQGHLLDVNDAYCRMSGYSEQELLSMSISDLEAAESAADVEEHIKNIIAGGEDRFETLQRRKDGSISDVEVSTVYIPGEPGKIVAFLRDITDRKRAEEELLRTAESLNNALAGTIRAMSRIVDLRDPYTAGHQKRMADLAGAIAAEMGMDEERVGFIRLAGSIHDIGKISVPAEILSKPAKLSETEFNLVRVHPQTGYDMLKDIDFPWPIADVILQHHERVDGSGYPNGLKGDEMLAEARILAVADVVESMASHRPYRATLGLDSALEEIEKNRGVLYTPAVVDACIALFRHKGYQLPLI